MDSYDGKDYKIWESKDPAMQETKKLIKDHYIKEQMYTCAYCRQEKKEDHGLTWDVEHILPASLYPQFLFEPENLAIACKECNIPKDKTNILKGALAKSGKYPKKNTRFTIIHPHFDDYSDHLEISIISKKRIYRLINTESDKGKNTYIACNLFRFDCKYGEWPSFDEGIVNHFTEILERCHPDTSIEELIKWLPTLSKVVLKDTDI